jgi:hypothetical protein
MQKETSITMDDLYDFETDQFGISKDSIHLLRNRYNFKTIDFSKIDSIEIKKGKDLKNWILVLLIGLGLLCFVFYDLIRIYEYYQESFIIQIERLLIPLFPFLLGLYSVMISFRKSQIMIVTHGNKKYYFSLRQMVKANTFDQFSLTIKDYYPLTRFEE